MLHAGALTNDIALNVMQQLGMTTTTPYRNVCGIDSKRVQVQSLIKGLKISLATYPNIFVFMDVVVIDVPDMRGMVLSRIWPVSLIGCLKMDLSYANIPTCDGYVTLHREPAVRYQVEDPKEPMNEVLYIDEECGNLTVYTNSLEPEKLETNNKES